MKPELSIVIPYLNDVDTLIGTLDSLYETLGGINFEVVVVDDGSKEKLPESEHRPYMAHVSHFVNLGVGAAFDTGVSACRADNIILMGADIRFSDNGWAKRMISILNKEPKAFVCTVCKSFTSERTEYGADLIFYQDNSNISKRHWGYRDKEFRTILQGRWRPKTGRGVYAIPCLMGAFYGVKKSWYEKVRGFELHYIWGSLESYISLKSYLLGGKVLIDTENETMHIWRNPSRKSKFDAVYYNQLMTAGVVFGTYGIKYAKFLSESTSRYWNEGARIYDDKMHEINELATYLADNAVMSPEQLEQLMVGLSYEYNNHDRFVNPIK